MTTRTLRVNRKPAFAATPLGYLYAVAAVPIDSDDDFYNGEVIGTVYRHPGGKLWRAYNTTMELMGERSTRELAGQILVRAS